jgi:hypothetical protein
VLVGGGGRNFKVVVVGGRGWREKFWGRQREGESENKTKTHAVLVLNFFFFFFIIKVG